jgi:hypothetical protein
MRSTWKNLNTQAGDGFHYLSFFAGANVSDFRQTFRPEIYYKDIQYDAQKAVKVVEKIISKDENIKFNSYIWS